MREGGREGGGEERRDGDMYVKPSLGWGKREADGVRYSRVYLAYVLEGGKREGGGGRYVSIQDGACSKNKKEREEKRKAKGLVRRSRKEKH